MDKQKNTHGGKREGSGRPQKDTDKRPHRYFLTSTEKEIIDSYRQSQGLGK